MTKVFLFGTGKSAEIVERNLMTDHTEIIGFADNDSSKQNKLFKGKPVISPRQLREYAFDYIIIGSLHYESISEQLVDLGIEKEKIISFYSPNFCDSRAYTDIICQQTWQMEVYKQTMDVKYEKLEKKLSAFVYNAGYELADKIKEGQYKWPIIKSSEELIALLVTKRYSLSRYGDGEFEIMRGRPRHPFQQINPILAERMREVLASDLPNHLVGIAPYYGDISQYDEKAQGAIREYLTPQVRAFHYQVLNMHKVYYDSCVSRPYVMHRDKEAAKQRFESLQTIWKDRNVLLVEGILTRMGVGNDLLSGATTVRRILGPSENAFDYYEQLMDAIQEHANKEDLILIALGAAATVLAYDLAQQGYQAIDIGHVDLEYEWFLQGKGERTKVANKYNNEISGGNCVQECFDTNYQKEILVRIG